MFIPIYNINDKLLLYQHLDKHRFTDKSTEVIYSKFKVPYLTILKGEASIVLLANAFLYEVQYKISFVVYE